MSEYVPALPHDDPSHLAAHHFLVEEAAILDAGDWARWLGLLTDDVRYVMPVRVTMVHDQADRGAGMAHFDEDRYAIEKRVQRLLTDHAWTEDPRSRTRHIVTNVRCLAGDDATIDVESTVLLFRSRADDRAPEWVCAPAARCVATRTRWRAAPRRSPHHCGGVRAAHPEPGHLPVNEPVELANEFAAVTVSVVETRNGVRLRIESPRAGRAIDLDPLELETLTWQSHDLFTGLLAEPFGPEEDP